MLGCFSRNEPFPFDPTGLEEPPMDERVLVHYRDRQVRLIDYCCNGAATVVGVALVFFSVWLFLESEKLVWTSLVLYGGVAFGGVVLTFLSIKWMVESCKKSDEFDRWATEVRRQEG